MDLRGRLDSKGVRYGKLIPYDVSEQRFTELMEGVCEGLGRYTREVRETVRGSVGGDGRDALGEHRKGLQEPTG